MPATAMFYHLTQSPIERTLPPILAKALQSGWRVLLRGSDADRLKWLDEKLWLDPEDGFLPHGLAGGPMDADQPILLGTGTGNANAAQCLVTVDGAEVTDGECATLTRLCILFDGNDPAAVERARAQWKSLTGAGLAAQYWTDRSGRWVMQSEKAAG